jgi:hypothetical protein
MRTQDRTLSGIITKCLALAVYLLCAAGCSRGPDKWSVTYSYSGDQVPSAAVATTQSGVVVARAERLEFLLAADGRRSGVVLKETYLQPDGSLSYTGKLYIRWSYDYGEPGTIERAERLSGSKPWTAFPDWPDGTDNMGF